MNEKSKSTLKEFLEKQAPAIKKALPAQIGYERFMRVAFTALSSSEKLQKCSPMSFLGALMTSAQLGLEANTPLGHAYLIPYNGRDGMQCQFQMGYKGILELAYRSGQIESIQSQVVKEGDFFEYEFGLNPILKHKPALERGKSIQYYAMLKLKGGGTFFEVMSASEVEKHRQRFSKAKSSDSPWNTDFDEMAKKTVVKKVLKYAPLSIELTNAISADESVKTAIAFDMSLVENELTTEPGSLPPAALPIADPLNPATKVDTEMDFLK